MCTVVVAHHPGTEVPLLIAAVRDEMSDRAWEWPGRHWPERPDLIGGRDTRDGGTWLALSTARHAGRGPRVGAVLNGRPPGGGIDTSTVPPGVRRHSRGRLPLLAAGAEALPAGTDELRHYEPFHLLVADTDTAVLHGWDGRRRTEQELAPGVSVLVNTGIDPAEPRARRYGPVFADALPRPEPGALKAARDPARIWGEWPAIVDEAAHGPARTGGWGAGPDDPSALTARVDLGDGRVWTSSSVTLVACSAGTARMAFTAAPGDPAAWRMTH